MEARREGGVHVLVEAHRADGQRVGQLREGVVVVVRRRRAALVVPRRRAHVERGAEFDEPRAQRVDAVPGGGGALAGTLLPPNTDAKFLMEVPPPAWSASSDARFACIACRRG